MSQRKKGRRVYKVHFTIVTVYFFGTARVPAFLTGLRRHQTNRGGGDPPSQRRQAEPTITQTWQANLMSLP